MLDDGIGDGFPERRSPLAVEEQDTGDTAIRRTDGGGKITCTIPRQPPGVSGSVVPPLHHVSYEVLSRPHVARYGINNEFGHAIRVPNNAAPGRCAAAVARSIVRYVV